MRPRKYDPGGKAQTVLTRLSSGKASPEQIYAAFHGRLSAAARRKVFHVLLALLKDGLIRRAAYSDFALTRSGRRALDELRRGEPVIIELRDAA